MVKIRLTRMGRHKLPYYRIVAVDSRTRRDGAFIELLGHYEPFSGKVDVKKELIFKWLNAGAQPSETILAILKDKGLWKEYQDSKVRKAKPNKKRKLSSAKKAKKAEGKKPKKIVKKPTKKVEEIKPEEVKVEVSVENTPATETTENKSE
ncbi:MAG: 30S ribosomal protein S16 [Mycoplasmoidaceae bacterium]